MEKHVSQSRWSYAQRYERSYWERRSAQIQAGGHQLAWYRHRAEDLLSVLESLELQVFGRKRTSVLEIGSGPVGTVSFLDATTMVAVDPLARFYASDEQLSLHRNPKVHLMAAVGERLPFARGSFDLLIMDNCIDHVRDVASVMREVKRVLRPVGVLYLAVNVRTGRGTVGHRALSRLRIDAGHPYSFTPRTVRSLLKAADLQVVDIRTGDYKKARQEDLSSGSWKARLKGALGLSEFVVQSVALNSHRGVSSTVL